jgi:phosphate acetyltransferase
MTQSIYVSAIQRGSGKSTVALGLVSYLERTLRQVGFFKPIGQHCEAGTDPDIQLMKEALGLKQTAEQMEPVDMEQLRLARANGTLDQLMDRILDDFHTIARANDFVVCEGTDYRGAMASLEFDINAQVAKDLGASILLVANAAAHAQAEDPVEELLEDICLAKESFDEKSCELFGVILNRVNPDEQKRLNLLVERKLSERGVRFLGSIPRVDLLERPRIEEIAEEIGAEILSGHDRLSVIAKQVEVAAMTLENALQYGLVPHPQGAVVVVPGDRDDVMLGLAAAYISSKVPAPAAVIMTGGLEPSKNVMEMILDITEGRMPLLKVNGKTYETTIEIHAVKPRIQAHHRTRIEIVKGLVERHIDIEPLLTRIVVGERAGAVTPKQFLHQLAHMARRKRSQIVLPEGEEERILRAAVTLTARKVADLTLLGSEETIEKELQRLGLTLEGVRIIDPSTSEWLEPFVERYLELRPEHKRPSVEDARYMMMNPTFFGTMMVHEGHAGGMVAGAINTTAHTLRPALQFIKTKEGVSIASSVFFMCLPTSVLVYGDCAVNRNPTAEQLADIALASAETAAAFEIEPRVAMLSYSTGDSGAGSDVEKVREATRLVKERAPNLPVEGPIQYDAAVDPTVAKAKLPQSRVAGAATVLIFPDLNAGNNTYKAVQRSSGAIAIGPVMQGLRMPVNDLSRGCTVADIFNTVAITAIQAQGIER